jgi:hypothetical protein
MKTLFLLDASKDVRGEMNEQKTKYMFMYHYQRGQDKLII